MQNGFVNEHSRHVIPRVIRLIDECRARFLPVVFTRFINSPGSPFERLIDWPHVAEPPDTDIVDELARNADVVIDKSFYSPFVGEFESLIAEDDWRTLILCGLSTESCVLKTAADAFECGLRPIVIADACASDAGPEAHEAGLFVLKYLIGEKQIMNADRLLTLLPSAR